MARVTGFWKKIGDAITPVFIDGVDLLIQGTNRYINFKDDTGLDGYGIRDNNGTLQFKNEAGTWTDFGSGGGGGDMLSTNNLSDVANVATARTNLGLGTAAQSAATDFATSAQGAKADTAVQPAAITNFETTTQLNTRDTNNRNRANHLGTQPASTITGLGAVATSNDYNDLSNLPDLSAFDNISEHANLAAFPATGESDKFYLAQDTGILYRWTGSAYVVISAQLALGETSATAYRGDRGKTAYDHSQLATGNPHNVTKSDVGLGNVDNTSDADKTISTATQTALNAKAPLDSPTFTGNTTVADLQVTGEFGADVEVDNGNSGVADTINWTVGNFQKSTMTGNVTYLFTAPTYVGRYQLMLVQDATGSRTATWPAAVKWPGGTAPILSTAANAIDIISFYFDGTNYFGIDSLDFR